MGFQPSSIVTPHLLSWLIKALEAMLKTVITFVAYCHSPFEYNLPSAIIDVVYF